MSTGKRGRPPVLSREIILDAAFRVVDSEATNDLTMSRLGRELKVDPSAVYRHFRDKDELLLAMADVMLREVLASYHEGDAPLENLRRMAWSLRRSYLRRPGLARYVYYRFTGGEAEAACVMAMLENMRGLGFVDQDALRQVRAMTELTLGHIALTADSVAQPPMVQTYELERATTFYSHPVQEDQLLAGDVREAVYADGEKVFTTMLETFLAGLVALAPAASPRTVPRARSARA